MKAGSGYPMEYQGEHCVTSPASPHRELSKHRAISEKQKMNTEQQLGKTHQACQATMLLAFPSSFFY
jgi:hypothetical protein